MNGTELRNLCTEWQNRLGLAHWRIDIRFGRRDEFENGVIANVTQQVEFERAVIKILESYQHSSLFSQDIEQSIVHELLHIVFATLDPEDGYYGVQKVLSEQVINRLAQVLVDLKRERTECGAGCVESPGEGERAGAFLPEVTI
jgi:hypothetical protein